MRGENLFSTDFVSNSAETSPHAWRKHPSLEDSSVFVRNISTCVEKTIEGLSGISYLPETSPHAWRKPEKPDSRRERNRNISTCVEKTSAKGEDVGNARKHLHMRGENLLLTVIMNQVSETSPHAWRKLEAQEDTISKLGNISTCVEKTSRQQNNRYKS